MHFRFFLLQQVVILLQLLLVLKDVDLLHLSFIVAKPSVTVADCTTSIISAALTASKSTHFNPSFHHLFLHHIHQQNPLRILHRRILPFLATTKPFFIVAVVVTVAFVIITTFADSLIADFCCSSYFLSSELAPKILRNWYIIVILNLKIFYFILK